MFNLHRLHFIDKALGIRSVLLGLFCMIASSSGLASVSVAQRPLNSGNNVPSNLILALSVEFPTVISTANLTNYDGKTLFKGYFDSKKCYRYQPLGNIPTNSPAAQHAYPKGQTGYFQPISVSSNDIASCTGAWSGNYLNWAATQTIDTFRSVMTGGYRVIDQEDQTVLEKARHPKSSNFNDRGIGANSTLVSQSTPSAFPYFVQRIQNLGNKMYFVSADRGYIKINHRNYGLNYLLDNPDKAPSAQDPNADHGVIPYTGQAIEPYYVYSVNVDVQVCVPSMPENNCVKYGSHYKPEGLLQAYSSKFKVAAFGYLDISNVLQDGGVLRAGDKFIGPYTFDPIQGQKTNPNMEWDPVTGVIYQNPDPNVANLSSQYLGTTISNSGVLNYLNKFAEMTSADMKSYDPVGELYYAAVRYLKNQGEVKSYSDFKRYGWLSPYDIADGFPIIRNWSDPIKYSCEKNYILGIADENTWDDKNLPNAPRTGGWEPALPPEVQADKSVDVSAALDQISKIEKIKIPTPFYSGGRANSAAVAALAYDSHTRDIRPDIKGFQNITSFWVDVEENQYLRRMRENQLMLAAKYGGFTLPSGFDPYNFDGPMPESWWSTNGETLTTSHVNEPRPDTFFEGGNPDQMVSGLTKAFNLISNFDHGSTASLGVHNDEQTDETLIFQSGYEEGTWTGWLKAYQTGGQQAFQDLAIWDASKVMPSYQQRKIFTYLGGQYEEFNSKNVSGNGWDKDTVNYVRGDQSREKQRGGSFRDRSTILGDIINSQAVYVGPPSTSAFTSQSFPGLESYYSFATSSAVAGRTPMVYVTANDGMLHGFDANTGKEVYAFMPGAVVNASNNPSLLANSSYGAPTNPHRYFNDGLITVANAYFGNEWHTVLAGSTGRGEAKAIYALDVTDPDNVKFLWELDGTNLNALGQTIGKPVIALTSSGWQVFFGNGYNSADNTASLISVEISDSPTPRVYIHNAGDQTDNGLSTPTILIRSAANGLASDAWAGDLKGNVWHFDLSNNYSSAQKVFTTRDNGSGINQPITSPILLSKDSSTGHLWGFFGTGKYLGFEDNGDHQVQSWYGLILDEQTPIPVSKLVERHITKEEVSPAQTGSSTTAGRTFTYSDGSDMINQLGWHIELQSPLNGAEGEKMISGNQLQNGLLIGTSLIPDNSEPCTPSGRGWVMAVNPFTGTNPTGHLFDFNNDQVFDDKDSFYTASGPLAVSGISIASLTTQPVFSKTKMLLNQNGKFGSQLFQPLSVFPQQRISWRQILDDQRITGAP